MTAIAATSMLKTRLGLNDMRHFFGRQSSGGFDLDHARILANRREVSILNVVVLIDNSNLEGAPTAILICPETGDDPARPSQRP